MKIHPHQRVIDLLTLVILLAGLLLPPSASASRSMPLMRLRVPTNSR